MNFKILAALLLAFSIAGCSVSRGNIKVKTMNTNSSEFQQLKLTDKQKVEGYLGSPDVIFKKEDMEIYEYNYTKVANSKWLFVPIVGIFYYGFIRNNSFVTKTVYFYFNDKDETVEQKSVKRSGKYPPSSSVKYKKKY